MSLAGVVRSRMSQEAVSDWTRARSVAEAVKSEVYLYLTAVAGYDDGGRDERLSTRVEELERDADDLLRHAAGIEPKRRPVPAVRDVQTYVDTRVSDQISEYYRPEAAKQKQRLARARRAELALAVVGATLGAAAAAFKIDSLAVWVPVLTTMSAAVTAHAAAERYEFLLVEYLRTATELERLRDRHGSAGGLGDEEFIRACERIISVQNEGWMAKLSDSDG